MSPKGIYPRKKAEKETATAEPPKKKEAEPYFCKFCNAPATPTKDGIHKCLCRRERA
jgi:hypothetical protein